MLKSGKNIIIQKLCVLCWFYQPADRFVCDAAGGSYETYRVLRNLLLEDVVFFGGRSYCWYSFFMTLAIVLSCMLEVPS